MKVFTIITILFLIVSFPVLSGGQSEPADKMEGGMMEAMEMPEVDAIVEYSSLEQVKMLAEEKPTVLFFNASWCPSCKGAVRDFEANEVELKGYYLVYVDYDSSADLQKTYGVTYQHTFVQIDSDGNAVTKWNGGGIPELLENVEVM
ncbi:MAG: thioredoxin family protein [Spirochaetales bacterium]|uniref:Thioredoxin family protein n=1 Tax=Candidatus Thalassospirochaeta sargassi TaxID=3119039 RepID=A0AAJ1IA51_9SPIO|nr:thioredoxin family protein [Spirochaetales bacterium]